MTTDTLYLVDVNNQFRVAHSTDNSGLCLRNAFNVAYHHQRDAVYVCDGFKSRTRRREFFPGYKAGRPPAPDNYYLQLGFYKELLMHTGKPVIEIPGEEADDIIAILAQTSERPVVIESTDRDFCALISERVSVPMATMKDVPIKDIPLFKTLVGDTSDNIGGIDKFGKAKFADLTEEHKATWRHIFSTGDWSKVDQHGNGVLGIPGTPKMNAWVDANRELLVTYWKAVCFLPLELDKVFAHMKCGARDYPLADSKLRDLLQ